MCDAKVGGGAGRLLDEVGEGPGSGDHRPGSSREASRVSARTAPTCTGWTTPPTTLSRRCVLGQSFRPGPLEARRTAFSVALDVDLADSPGCRWGWRSLAGRAGWCRSFAAWLSGAGVSGQLGELAVEALGFL